MRKKCKTYIQCREYIQGTSRYTYQYIKIDLSHVHPLDEFPRDQTIYSGGYALTVFVSGKFQEVDDATL